jgi:cell division protein FtsZ
MRQAEEGMRELKDAVDTLIAIPNQRLLAIAGRDTSLLETFKKADDILLQAVRGISDLITVHGLINLDFADVRTIMAEMGMAMMGAGSASGENRAVEAAQKAVSSPLLEDISIHGARGVLINITGSHDLSLHEVNEAATLIQEEAHEDANIIFGAVIDEQMGDEIRITVIATGFGEAQREVKKPGFSLSKEPVASTLRSTPPRTVPRDGDPARPVVHLGTIVDAATPTFQRHQPGTDRGNGADERVEEFTMSPEESDDHYAIPAFLRKNAI